MIATNKPQFPLGRVVATPAALEVMNSLGIEPKDLLQRHVFGDFGDCDEHDRLANEEAVENGDRVFSVYEIGDSKLWVITEADRSSTCILTPEDY